MTPDDLADVLDVIADALEDPDHSTAVIRERIRALRYQVEIRDEAHRRRSIDGEFGEGAYDRRIAKLREKL